MTEPSKPSPWSVSIANNAAVGHFNAGLNIFRELEDLLIEARKSGEELNLASVLELEIPAVTNLSLGIELFFKVHYFQIFAKYLHGHDARSLSKQFPDERLDELRRIYHQIYNQPGESTGLEMRYSDGSGEHREEMIRKDFSTDDLAVEQIGSTYVKWRYIYEQFGDSFNMRIAFGPFYFLSKTLHTAVQGFKGNLRVHRASGPVIWHAP